MDIKLDPKALLGLRLIDENLVTISSKIGKNTEQPMLAAKVGRKSPAISSKVGKNPRR